MSSSFYVVVASEASIEQYPENTPSSFKMQLPSQLHLSENWEVAMTHIIYPHTWENIHSNQVSYLLRYNGEKEWTLPIYLPRDTYRTVEDLLFEVPVTDVSIVKSKWVDYEPIQSGTNPIEFVIKPLSDYIDINKTELRLVVKITKRNGGETGAGEKYTLINNAPHSIIKQFTIKINETLVTEQSDTQAYNAYIKTLLNFTDQAKKSYLTKALYYKDTAGHMDEVNNTADGNLGLKKRGSFTTGDAEV